MNTVIADMWAKLRDPFFARRVGFLDTLDPDYTTEQLGEEEMLSEVLGRILVAVSCHETQSAMRYTSRYPNAFLMLLDRNPEARNSALQTLKVDWDHIQALFHTSKYSAEVALFAKEMQFPYQSFVIETFYMLVEHEFKEPFSEELVTALRRFGRSLKSSVIDENAFNRLRAVSANSAANIMGRESRWSTLAHSTLLEDQGYKPAVVDALARAQSKKILPPSTFVCDDASTCSLGSDVVSMMLDEKHWVHPSPMKDKVTPMTWLSWKERGDATENFLRSWRSLLAVPGALISCESRQVRGIVCGVSPFGFLWMPVTIHDLGNGQVVLRYKPKAHLQFGVVHDYSEWKMAHPELCSPAKLRHSCNRGASAGFGWVMSKRGGGTLVSQSARAAFPMMTKFYLDKLVAVEGLHFAKGSRPRSVDDLLRVLIKHYVPGIEEKQVDEIVGKRAKPRKAEKSHCRDKRALFGGCVRSVGTVCF